MLRWRPDTCGCAFEFEGKADPATVVTAQCCPLHTTVAEVIEENQLKNRAVTRLETLLQAVDPTVTASDITWEFDAERNVRLTMPAAKALRGAAKLAASADLAALSPRIVLV